MAVCDGWMHWHTSVALHWHMPGAQVMSPSSQSQAGMSVQLNSGFHSRSMMCAIMLLLGVLPNSGTFLWTLAF